MIKNFILFLFAILIISALQAQEQKSSVFSEQDVGLKNKPSVEANPEQSESSPKSIPDMQPERIKDVEKMLVELEKAYANYLTSEQASLNKIIERIAPNCPLDINNPDFYQNEMYLWVNMHNMQYTNLLSFLTKNDNQPVSVQERISLLETKHKQFTTLPYPTEYIFGEIFPEIQTERTIVAPHFPSRVADSNQNQTNMINWIENYPDEFDQYIHFLNDKFDFYNK